jgi:NitT/TauT family transport system substrate-binding protein
VVGRRLTIARLGLASALALATMTSRAANAADHLTLQLLWVTQAQFAGYYVAKDKGFYQDVGLDVTIKPGGPDTNNHDVVAAGKADVTVDCLACAVAARERGLALVNISQIFQRSGYVLTCLKSSGIRKISDLPGHSVGVWFYGKEYLLLGWMAKHKIPTQGGPDGVTLVNQRSIDLLINKQAACISTQIYNEYWRVIDLGFKPENLVVFKYSDDGGANLEDGLYVVGDRLSDPAFADKLSRFVAASLRGWSWAIDHPEEAVRTVLANDTTHTETERHQTRMITEIGKLITETSNPLGYLNPADYEKVVADLLASPVSIISKRPEGAWTHAIYEASKKYWTQ